MWRVQLWEWLDCKKSTNSTQRTSQEVKYLHFCNNVNQMRRSNIFLFCTYVFQKSSASEFTGLGMHFSTAEAFYVGRVAHQHDKFQHAFHWFLYSLQMLNHPKSLRSIRKVTKEFLLNNLSYSAHYFGSLSVAVDFYRQLLNLGEVCCRLIISISHS